MRTATVTGRVQGKIAVVTGAADGIGRAVAHMLSKLADAEEVLDDARHRRLRHQQRFPSLRGCGTSKFRCRANIS